MVRTCFSARPLAVRLLGEIGEGFGVENRANDWRKMSVEPTDSSTESDWRNDLSNKAVITGDPVEALTISGASDYSGRKSKQGAGCFNTRKGRSAAIS